MNANKPGYRTTEFWVTIVLGGLSMLTALGIVGPSEGDYVRGHIQQWAILASGIIAFGYNLSRAIAKHRWAAAEALVEQEFSGGGVVLDSSVPDGI